MVKAFFELIARIEKELYCAREKIPESNYWETSWIKIVNQLNQILPIF